GRPGRRRGERPFPGGTRPCPWGERSGAAPRPRRQPPAPGGRAARGAAGGRAPIGPGRILGTSPAARPLLPATGPPDSTGQALVGGRRGAVAVLHRGWRPVRGRKGPREGPGRWGGSPPVRRARARRGRAPR